MLAEETLKPLVEKALSRSMDASLHLGDELPIADGKRHHVHRFPVLDGPLSAPGSVVVKTALMFGDEVYDPDSTAPMAPARRLFQEWAGLQFLGEISADPKLAPELYAGDRESGFFVIEDLGEGTDSPDNLLLGNDPTVAKAALLEIAGTLGLMHARSIGGKSRFDSIRDSLGGRAYSEHDYTQLHRSFLAWMEALHLNPESGAIEDVDAVISSMAEPGPFLAYTHGDPCPDNWLRDSTGLRLIDFEGGGFRHALTDGVYGRIHFPTCWCVNRLPGDIPIEMENEYRTALSEGCPKAREDVRFYNGVVDACAYHMLTGFSADRIAALMREDQSWGISTVRQRALVRFDILSRLTKEFSHREPLGEAYARIAEKLRGVWPAEADQMPVYPAFR